MCMSCYRAFVCHWRQWQWWDDHEQKMLFVLSTVCYQAMNTQDVICDKLLCVGLHTTTATTTSNNKNKNNNNNYKRKLQNLFGSEPTLAGRHQQNTHNNKALKILVITIVLTAGCSWAVTEYYDDDDDDDLMCCVYVGLRPERPADCDRDCWDLMNRCWHGEPLLRPHVGELEIALRGIYDRLAATSVTSATSQLSTSDHAAGSSSRATSSSNEDLAEIDVLESLTTDSDFDFEELTLQWWRKVTSACLFLTHHTNTPSQFDVGLCLKPNQLTVSIFYSAKRNNNK